jgi:hypothetical protein
MFRFGDRQHVLLMKIYFNPEREGVPPSAQAAWSESDWNKYAIGKHPEKEAYVVRLRAWTVKWEPLMRAAWERRPPDAAARASQGALP